MEMIDILFYIIIILAVIQGWRTGLIVAFFSLICGLIGLAAAVKLSAVVADRMGSDMHLAGRWVPIIAFVLVFVLVLLLVRWGALLLKKITSVVLLGWLDKLGGILFYLILYVSIYSIVLFYGARAGIISKHSIELSGIYSTIAPLGPEIIRFITGFFPFGKDMFNTLEAFFEKLSHKVQ
jgi:membrane protein required for colicin V production